MEGVSLVEPKLRLSGYPVVNNGHWSQTWQLGAEGCGMSWHVVYLGLWIVFINGTSSQQQPFLNSPSFLAKHPQTGSSAVQDISFLRAEAFGTGDKLFGA